jgi:hypothetical protein
VINAMLLLPPLPRATLGVTRPASRLGRGHTVCGGPGRAGDFILWRTRRPRHIVLYAAAVYGSRSSRGGMTAPARAGNDPGMWSFIECRRYSPTERDWGGPFAGIIG